MRGAEFFKRGSGHALSFDGRNDYVDCGTASTLDVRGTVTVMAWVFPHPSQSGEVGLVLRKDWAHHGMSYSTQRCYWYISGGGNHCYSELEVSAWNHVAGTYDGKVMRLYINGEQKATRPLVTPIRNGGNFLIGRVAYGNGHFRGAIDDVSIWNRVLTAEEIGVFAGQRYMDDTPPGEATYAIPLTVTSRLPVANVPMDPVVRFSALMSQSGLQGFVDTNSIQIVNMATGRTVPRAVADVTPHSGARVQWVIEERAHRAFEIRFKTAPSATPLRRRTRVPLIGTGDLLRYNAAEGRPFAPTRDISGLADLTGDGKRDLIGIWSYAHRPGEPWNPMVLWPRVGSTDEFKFGDMRILRRLPNKYYSSAHIADLNKDGLPDLAYEKAFSGDGQCRTYLHRGTGKRDVFTGLSSFQYAGQLPAQRIEWHSIRMADLDNDGALDVLLIDDGRYTADPATYLLANTNPNNWPLSLALPARIDVKGIKAAFFDVDGDGLLDAVSLIDNAETRGLSDYHVGWQRNLGRDAPSFGPVRDLPAINKRIRRPRDLLAVNDGDRKGLLIVCDDKQRTAFFAHKPGAKAAPRFEHFADAQCDSAVISASDQAWPSVCDWDGDGDWDLLIGGGYGWPRILINNGSSAEPVLSEPQLIPAQGGPIRILREEVLGAPGHRHNMGYPFPVYVDWDADGLPDLMLPNETNRILWYKNIGTRRQPKFGKQRQVQCDGHPDSPEKRARSVKLATGSKGCYPPEDDRPFPWRCGAGFADWNGDGLMDMVTTSGVPPRRATLFTQYRDAGGNLRLKKDRLLKTVDGGTFYDSRYVCVDWDGDGDLDIVCSDPSARKEDTVFLARNQGTSREPVFEYAPLRVFGEPIYITRHGPNVDAADMDGDGLPDILACVEWSVYPFYRHAAFEMKRRPTVEIGCLKEQ